MNKYIYLDHTADAAFIAYGKTLEEAFSNAAVALFDIIVDTKKVNSKKEISFTVTSKRQLALLYDFIDELLFRLDTEGFALHTVKNIAIDKNTLTCTLTGDHISNYEFSGDIKSVTYNDMSIKKVKNHYELQVVVDL